MGSPFSEYETTIGTFGSGARIQAELARLHAESEFRDSIFLLARDFFLYYYIVNNFWLEPGLY
jgi:hypothetical protein